MKWHCAVVFIMVLLLIYSSLFKLQKRTTKHDEILIFDEYVRWRKMKILAGCACGLRVRRNVTMIAIVTPARIDSCLMFVCGCARVCTCVCLRKGLRVRHSCLCTVVSWWCTCTTAVQVPPFTASLHMLLAPSYLHLASCTIFYVCFSPLCFCPMVVWYCIVNQNL